MIFFQEYRKIMSECTAISICGGTDIVFHTEGVHGYEMPISDLSERSLKHLTIDINNDFKLDKIDTYSMLYFRKD